MTTNTMRVLLITGLGTLAMTASAAATALSGSTDARPVKAATIQLAQQCYTDDGYGRRRPCSASYKRQHPDWRAGDSCYTDDGYGRKRPCSAAYKAKFKK